MKYALVRSTYNNGYFQFLKCEIEREDGWVKASGRWFAPHNVIYKTELEVRSWDNNDIPPGTLCEFERAEYNSASMTWEVQIKQCVVIQKSRQSYEVLVGDTKTHVGSQGLVPVLGSYIPIKEVKKSRARKK